MGNWITPHSFLSLSWDEWCSIVAILTAVILIIRWAINRAYNQLFNPILEAINKLKDATSYTTSRLEKAEARLEKGDKMFIRHDDELQDHERRISHLEERK